jgi:hypothetical protein
MTSEIYALLAGQYPNHSLKLSLAGFESGSP